MRILASDGMEKNAVATLRAQGHEVVEQFYEPAELAEQVKNFASTISTTSMQRARASRL